MQKIASPIKRTSTLITENHRYDYFKNITFFETKSSCFNVSKTFSPQKSSRSKCYERNSSLVKDNLEFLFKYFRPEGRQDLATRFRFFCVGKQNIYFQCVTLSLTSSIEWHRCHHCLASIRGTLGLRVTQTKEGLRRKHIALL